MSKEKLIPLTDVWNRDEFLLARRAQIHAQQARRNPNEIVFAANDQILCDFCDDVVLGEFINLVDFGARVACGKCFKVHYLSRPMTYRKLKSDGSLGEFKNG